MVEDKQLPNTEEVSPDSGEEQALLPQNIVDMVAFGRRLRAQRVLNGYDRAADFVQTMRSRYGVDISERTLYAFERGEQMPHVDFFFAMVACLEVPFDYFAPAFRHDVMETVRKNLGV